VKSGDFHPPDPKEIEPVQDPRRTEPDQATNQDRRKHLQTEPKAGVA
jgi:hypothetical protein